MTAEQTYRALIDRGIRFSIEGDRLLVGPGDRLTDDDRVAIKRHRDELLLIASYAAVPLHAEPRREHATPAGCVGPRACAVLGPCGRETCGDIPDISPPATDYERAA